MSKNSNCGTYLPSTTRQTVSGADSTSPTGPHSHAQNAADTKSATSLTPIVWPNNSGSAKLAVTTSSTATRPITNSGCVQPMEAARLRAIGGTTATQTPRY